MIIKKTNFLGAIGYNGYTHTGEVLDALLQPNQNKNKKYKA